MSRITIAAVPGTLYPTTVELNMRPAVSFTNKTVASVNIRHLVTLALLPINVALSFIDAKRVLWTLDLPCCVL